MAWRVLVYPQGNSHLISVIWENFQTNYQLNGLIRHQFHAIFKRMSVFEYNLISVVIALTQLHRGPSVVQLMISNYNYCDDSDHIFDAFTGQSLGKIWIYRCWNRIVGTYIWVKIPKCSFKSCLKYVHNKQNITLWEKCTWSLSTHYWYNTVQYNAIMTTVYQWQGLKTLIRHIYMRRLTHHITQWMWGCVWIKLTGGKANFGGVKSQLRNSQSLSLAMRITIKLIYLFNQIYHVKNSLVCMYWSDVCTASWYPISVDPSACISVLSSI